MFFGLRAAKEDGRQERLLVGRQQEKRRRRRRQLIMPRRRRRRSRRRKRRSGKIGSWYWKWWSKLQSSPSLHANKSLGSPKQLASRFAALPASSAPVLGAPFSPALSSFYWSLVSRFGEGPPTAPFVADGDRHHKAILLAFSRVPGAPGVGDGGDGGLTGGVLVANFAFGSFFVEEVRFHSYHFFGR